MIINNPKVQIMLKEVKNFLLKIDENKKTYFTNSVKERFKTDYRELHYKLTHGEFKNIISDEIKRFIRIYNELDNLVKEWNKQYVENELNINEDLLSNIDGKSLDVQQRRAVVVDEDNNLILAGAGSGKTLTIAAKVKYLVETKNINPNEILLISFTKKAAEEMNERIATKLGLDVEASTFHKLGIDIISKYRGKRPDVDKDLLKDVIEDYFKNIIYYDSKTLEDLIIFLGYYVNIPKEIDCFNNIGDYYKYCKSLDLTTLKGKSEVQQINKLQIEELKKEKKTIKGEKVKSIEEVIIANFLYLNGIDYKYEEKYPYETGDKFKKTYRPDFYLPEYDIYIEHFGINRKNKASHLSKIERIKYEEGMKWKKELHKEKNTTLIETYSYYQSEGILLQKLRNKLINNGAELKEVDYKEVYKTIYENEEDKYFKELRKLIETFITLFKSSGNDLQDFSNLYKEVLKIPNKFIRERSTIILNLVKPIYIKYEDSLYKNGQIDFNDMINESTEIVKSRGVTLNYKYIIIDEYQDISKSRFNLIKAIKDVSDSKLICVGDDWQSIYRFSGSDIDLFTNFKEYVGYYELLKIEKTYRNSQDLIDIAGKFVLKNKKQIDKNLKSRKVNSNPIKIITYRDNLLAAFEKSIDYIIAKFGTHAEITLLGRNNYDINCLSKESTNGEFSIKKNHGEKIVKSKKYPGLKMKFLTVHKSKGLEADNVIILNLENKISGFPNQIEDDPILDLVLTQSEDYMFAEERRLFYVALTRTKNKCYLIAPEARLSIFCDELIEDFKLSVECVDKKENEKIVKCPKCLVGNLVHRKNYDKGYSFVSCSNYPVCDFNSNFIEILDNPVICKSCGGFMVKREGYRGIFLGCTNFPCCINTEEYIYQEITQEQSFQKSQEASSNCNYYQVSECVNSYTTNSVEKEDNEWLDEEDVDYEYYCNEKDNKIIEQSEEQEFSERIKENIELYVKDKNTYRYYLPCISDIKLESGNIIRDYNKYFIVNKLSDNKVYLNEIDSNIVSNTLEETKTILTLYLENDYYKKYLTDIEYSIDDIFVNGNNEFIITDIFKDTIFMQAKEEQEVEINKDTIENKNELLKQQMEEFRIDKIKKQLLELKSKAQIIWDEKLWIEGLIKYIEGNLTRNTFCDLDILEIIYCDKLLNSTWVLRQIDYLKESDIQGYKNTLYLLEEVINNEEKSELDYIEGSHYYDEVNTNNYQDIKKYIQNSLKCNGEKCIECSQRNFICKDCELFFNEYY